MKALTGKLAVVEDLAIEALLTDGGHHKQWFLERILEEIGWDREELYKKYGFEKGIAP